MGTLLGLISISRDITDRILHEQEIQQKEARYRNLLEVFPDALLSANQESSNLPTHPRRDFFPMTEHSSESG